LKLSSRNLRRGATLFEITTMRAKFIPDLAAGILRNTFPIIASVVGG
jgi:hypothetical protein